MISVLMFFCNYIILFPDIGGYGGYERLWAVMGGYERDYYGDVLGWACARE